MKIASNALMNGGRRVPELESGGAGPTPAPRLRAVKSGSVVFALGGPGRPAAALTRALALARVLDANLHVVRVLPEPARAFPFLAPANPPEALRGVTAALAAEGSTRAWLRSAYAGLADTATVTVAHGEFVARVAAFAAEVGALLIVVPPREGRIAGTVTRLVATSGVPVLVARAPAGHDPIVAATDLASRDFPVLRKATELAHRLEVPLVAVHNVAPPPTLVVSQMPWLYTADHAPRHEAASKRLDRAVRAISGDADRVVREDLDAANAILDVARARDADLIVVGQHERGGLRRVLLGSVTARVIDNAARSVLVTPMPVPSGTEPPLC